MTPRERFILALERKSFSGRVPHFERPEDYDELLVQRNGVTIAELDGDATSYVDAEIDTPGRHIYTVVAVRDDPACLKLSRECSANLGRFEVCDSPEDSVGGASGGDEPMTSAR